MAMPAQAHAAVHTPLQRQPDMRGRHATIEAMLGAGQHQRFRAAAQYGIGLVFAQKLVQVRQWRAATLARRGDIAGFQVIQIQPPTRALAGQHLGAGMTGAMRQGLIPDAMKKTSPLCTGT